MAKFTLTFKTPYVLDQIQDQVTSKYPDDEPDSQRVMDEIDTHVGLADKFVKSGEYITVEFNTETGQATVVKV